MFAGGNLPSSPVAKSFTLTTANRFVPATGDKSVLTAVAGSGLFSGTLVDVASGRPKSFFGAFFKADNSGAGFFKNTTGEIGSVEIGPP